MATKVKPDELANHEMSDHHQHLTDIIVKKMEEAVKYEKPWFNCEVFPYNPVTKTQYKGINVISLLSRGFDDPRFLTFLNIQHLSQEIGEKISIKKGEKGTAIFKAIQRVFTDEDEETGEEEKHTFWQYTYAGTVFNASQLIGMPPLTKKKPKKFNTEEEAEKILKAMCEMTKLKVEHRNQDIACYHPKKDIVYLPPKKSFKSSGHYYSTLMHELGHATGHETRLNRNLTGRFADPNYSFEELIAELSSYFMGATINLHYDSKVHENHAGYLKSWIKGLKKDKNMIFKAASHASKAVEYQVNIKKTYYGEVVEKNNVEEVAVKSS